MTLSATPRRAGPLLGDGAQTAWPFSFKTFAEDEIRVVVADEDGLETTLVLNTHYTVALNGNQETSPGGTITYPISGAALATGSSLTIVSALDFDQPLDLPSGGNFSPLALENQLDRTVMQIQQLDEVVDRTLQLPVTVSGVSSQLPVPESNALIGWNSQETALQNFPLTDIATSLAFATFRYDTFTGNGTQTSFALNANPASAANMDVSVDGLTCVPGVDFTLVAGSIIFTSAPINGAEILVRYGQALPASYGDAADVTYLAAGTGAVSSSVQSKLREAISVKDFGAVGNNVTDDTVAFQHAITACEATQTRLHIPEGSYVLSARLTINKTFDISCDASAAMRWTNASSCGIFLNFVDGSDTLCRIELPQLMSPAISSSFSIPGYSSVDGWDYDLSSRVGSAVHLKGGNRIKLRIHYAKGWDAGVLVEPTNTATVDNIECDVGVLDFCVYGLKVINSGTASSKGLSQFGFTANTIWAKYPLYFDTSYGYILSSRFTVNGVFVNEDGGCVVYGVGTNFTANEIKIDFADAGLRADSVPATTADLRCPFLGGNQTSNGLSYDGMGTSPNIGYWGGKHCHIGIGAYSDPLGIDLGSASPIPAAGHTIRIRDAGRFNSITVLNMADDTGNTPIATSAVGESNYNGGVGGAQHARAVYTSATVTSLGAGASTDQYIYHQLVSSANIRPINVVMRNEGALNNNIVVEAYPTQTTNREIRVRIKNNGTGSFTGTVYFWVVVGD